MEALAFNVYDLFGVEWTLSHFLRHSEDDSLDTFLAAAQKMHFPLKLVVLKGEDHADSIGMAARYCSRETRHPCCLGGSQRAFNTRGSGDCSAGYSQSEILTMAEQEFPKMQKRLQAIATVTSRL